MLLQSIEQLGAKTEIALHKLRVILRTIHAREVKDKVRLFAILVKLRLSAVDIIFIYLFDIQRGSGAVIAVAKAKIELYQNGVDPTDEVGKEAIKNSTVDFTSDETMLKEAKFHIVAVPTPVNTDHTPDLSPVIGAKRLHIPIFHMEAGNRCKDECLPEETNSRIVDIISDVNLAYSEHARRYLADTGLPKERTYVTGSPMAEVLHNNLAQIETSDIHSRLGLENGKYILLSAHREENIDTEKNFTSLFTAINKMVQKYDLPILYSCHPRSKKRLEASGFKLDNRVIQHEPLGFHDYNCLQMNAFAVVSDSGTLPEESSFFTSIGKPFPAVCIRTSTERPEALDKACFILAGIDEKSLLQAVDTAVEMNKNGDIGIPVPDYTDENVSDKVVKIIQSYTGVVNKMVWRKDV